MDPATILADVQLAISIGKMAVELGQDAGPFLINAYDIAFENKVLTAAERQTMRDQETAFRASIDATISADAADDAGTAAGA
jgi:hypothetical protein